VPHATNGADGIVRFDRRLPQVRQTIPHPDSMTVSGVRELTGNLGGARLGLE
jgi:hypothetical protein